MHDNFHKAYELETDWSGSCKVPTTDEGALNRLARLFAADPAQVGYLQCSFLMARAQDKSVKDAYKHALDSLSEILTVKITSFEEEIDG